MFKVPNEQALLGLKVTSPERNSLRALVVLQRRSLESADHSHQTGENSDLDTDLNPTASQSLHIVVSAFTLSAILLLLYSISWLEAMMETHLEAGTSFK